MSVTTIYTYWDKSNQAERRDQIPSGRNWVSFPRSEKRSCVAFQLGDSSYTHARARAHGSVHASNIDFYLNAHT